MRFEFVFLPANKFVNLGPLVFWSINGIYPSREKVFEDSKVRRGNEH